MLDRIDERDLPLTQESIAQMLGAPDTRDRFQQDGLIRKRRGHIVVLDRAGLEPWEAEDETAPWASQPKLVVSEIIQTGHRI
jgi:hypothetical protein